jgi:hypothetical protein
LLTQHKRGIHKLSVPRAPRTCHLGPPGRPNSPVSDRVAERGGHARRGSGAAYVAVVESAWYADRQDDQHGDGEERYGNAAFWPEVPIAYECQQKPDDSQDDERISSPVPTGPVAWADLKTGVSPQPEHHAKRTQRGAARTYPQPEHAKSIR